MEMPGFMFDENIALKAEVASLKLQNESLEIRLAAANDKIASLQQFYEGETVMRRTAEATLDGVTKSLATPCDTAFAALQVVCKHWDREECFADLRKQRSENLRRIDALKSGRELKMGTVMGALEEDTEHPMGTLLYTLNNLREQLRIIFLCCPISRLHGEWFQPPLSLFREYADQDVNSSDEAMYETDEDDDSESME